MVFPNLFTRLLGLLFCLLRRLGVPTQQALLRRIKLLHVARLLRRRTEAVGRALTALGDADFSGTLAAIVVHVGDTVFAHFRRGIQVFTQWSLLRLGWLLV